VFGVRCHDPPTTMTRKIAYLRIPADLLGLIKTIAHSPLAVKGITAAKNSIGNRSEQKQNRKEK
nr:hypothetical protein [Methanocorpusculum sp.]